MLFVTSWCKPLKTDSSRDIYTYVTRLKPLFDKMNNLINCCCTLHKKPYFLFPNVLKKWSFQKSHWNIIFLVSSEKIFFSPKMWSYSLGGKWKMIFLKKIHGNMIYSSNVLKRWSFQKNCTGIWSFLYHEERWHFFFPKIWYFFYGRKMKDDISQKIHGNMMFSVCW